MVPEGPGAELPRPLPLPARSRAILIGDWLSDAGDVAAMLRALSAEGARGSSGPDRRSGRGDFPLHRPYRIRRRRQRRAVAAGRSRKPSRHLSGAARRPSGRACRGLPLSRLDLRGASHRPARFGSSAAPCHAGVGWATSLRAPPWLEEASDVRPGSCLHGPGRPRGAAAAAGALLPAARHPAAATADSLSAPSPDPRHAAQGRNPGPHAALAAAAAHRGGGPGDPGHGRPHLEPAAAKPGRQGAAAGSSR